MLAQPCPYCSGVRVIKNGRPLCASCGSEPVAPPVPPTTQNIQEQILALSAQLGSATDPALRRAILHEIERLSSGLPPKDGGKNKVF